MKCIWTTIWSQYLRRLSLARYITARASYSTMDFFFFFYGLDCIHDGFPSAMRARGKIPATRAARLDTVAAMHLRWPDYKAQRGRMAPSGTCPLDVNVGNHDDATIRNVFPRDTPPAPNCGCNLRVPRSGLGRPRGWGRRTGEQKERGDPPWRPGRGPRPAVVGARFWAMWVRVCTRSRDVLGPLNAMVLVFEPG
jgi:hypothetical protein